MKLGLGLALNKGLVVSSAPDPYGPELIINGSFDTDANWTKGTGWTISGGAANADALGTANINQSDVMEIGKTYLCTYTVSNYVSGGVVPLFGGQTGDDKGTIQSSNGTFTDTRVATNPKFYIRANNGFVGSIDNVSVKEVL